MTETNRPSVMAAVRTCKMGATVLSLNIVGSWNFVDNRSSKTVQHFSVSFLHRIVNNMATAQNLYLDLGFMAITNERLELSMWNFKWW